MSLNLIRTSFRINALLQTSWIYPHLACFTNTNQLAALMILHWMIHVIECLDRCLSKKLTRFLYGMFGKKKLINILFWLTSKWVFQQELIILVPIQTILGFLYGGLCALRLERWLSAIFQSLSLPFSHQGLEMS